ncbi:MAG: biopolymer transporter ExbD [Myxococcota bacterium]|nr:biopolymer transporter ExbD [Myxococcota bacterium]MDW8361419.1 biopolymer transporter ExbD [Myxococcales bacterium]
MAELTPAQRQYVRKRTKVHDLDPSEMVGELNIVPFLDVVVNLIMFLLMTTTVILQVVELSTQLPAQRRGGARGAAGPQGLNLTVVVATEGIIVTGSGGKLAPGCDRVAGGAVITVPRRPLPVTERDGRPVAPPRMELQYDWAALGECLQRVKSEYPDENQVTLTADPLVQYGDFVAAMDAVRFRRDASGRRQELFRDVLLAAGVR